MDAGNLATILTIVATMVGLELALLLWIVPRAGGSVPYARMVLVAAALLGSAGLLVAALWALWYPGLNSATILLEAAGIGMGFPPGLWMISVIVWRDARTPSGGWVAPALLATLAISGEILMGYVIALVRGESHGPLGWVGASLTSPWYLGSMALSMGVLALWVTLPRALRIGLVGLAVSGALGAGLLADPVPTVVGMATVSTAAIVAIIGDVRRGTIAPDEVAWLRGVVVGLAAVGVLAAAVVLPGDPAERSTVFGVGMTAVMAVEFVYLLRAGWAGTFVAPRAIGPPLADRAPGNEADRSGAFPSVDL